MSKKPGRTIATAAALLLAACILSGCSISAILTGRDPKADAEKTADTAETAEAAPTLSPEEEAAEKERQERLEKQQDGFLLDDGWLYAVDGEGNLRRDTWAGVLRFGEDGRYTSGSEELDRLVADVIRTHTEEGMTRLEMLRAMYDYTLDNIRYIGYANHENTYKPAHGENGWMTESAIEALENGTGNCFHFAATLAALARGLGYQAYAVSGLIGSEEQEHGWVEIQNGNEEIRYCDPETEYARKYWMDQEYDLFWKTVDDIGAVTGIDYKQWVDPMEAERKEAEVRSHTLPKSTPTPAAEP